MQERGGVIVLFKLRLLYLKVFSISE
jgi:hypothetical protein